MVAINDYSLTRRQSLWEVEEETWEQGELFAETPSHVPAVAECPLPEMNYGERIQADFAGMGVTAGKHPMALIRPRLPKEISTAMDLKKLPHGASASTAGAVICRQRPGTAKGVVFITLEDETGLSNSIVYADRFEDYRLTITTEPFLLITGKVQQAEGTTHLMAEEIQPLQTPSELPAAASHDFH